MKKNNFTLFLSILLALNILTTCFLAVLILKPDIVMMPNTSIHYTLHIGLNDKDSYEQIIPTDEAKKLVDEICTKYVSGFTVQDAIGAWSDENGILTHENTIICHLDTSEEKTVYLICDELRHALNQNTVLIQKEVVQLDFYAGEDGE